MARSHKSRVASTPAAPDPAVLLQAARRLAASFSALCGDLPNVFSEGNPAGRVFHRWTLPLDASIALTADSLAQALKARAPRHVDLEDGADRLRLDPDGDGADVALGYRLLAQAMQATLDDVHIAWVRGGPSASVPTYIFGRLAGGPLAGVRVTTIET
jgi:hypothetical protein